jgi:MtN3 and saliva related transmembrane protein
VSGLSITQVIGTIAGVLTTAAFLPQVWRTWKSKSADELSMTMLVTFATGICGWLAYGLLLNEAPIIVSNLVTLVLTSFLIVFKVRYSARRDSL